MQWLMMNDGRVGKIKTAGKIWQRFWLCGILIRHDRSLKTMYQVKGQQFWVSIIKWCLVSFGEGMIGWEWWWLEDVLTACTWWLGAVITYAWLRHTHYMQARLLKMTTITSAVSPSRQRKNERGIWQRRYWDTKSATSGIWTPILIIFISILWNTVMYPMWWIDRIHRFTSMYSKAFARRLGGQSRNKRWFRWIVKDGLSNQWIAWVVKSNILK